MEIWKDIEGFDYAISNQGRVFSYKSYIFLRNIFRGDGYICVNLYRDGLHKSPLHRLVATAFIPNPNNYPQVNHIDGDKTNNNVSNLEWCTTSYNNLHKFILRPELRTNPRTKLCDEEVREVYKLAWLNVPRWLIGECYNISKTCVTSIKHQHRRASATS